MQKYYLGQASEKVSLVLNIEDNFKHIGIFLSGGIDSTILLWSLLKYRQEFKKKFLITCLSVDKVLAANYVQRILNLLAPYYGEIDHHSGIDNSGSQPGAIRQAIYRMLADDRFDLIMTGVNSNPPETLIKIATSHPVRPASNNHSKLVLPFMHLFKCHIIELAYQLQADWILPYTHTCTELLADSCHQCFACQERAWGFNYNSKQDPSFKPLGLNDL